MARMKTIASIEKEIEKVQESMIKAKKEYDDLATNLLELQKQKDQNEADRLLKAFKKSGKSLHEVMTFLGVKAG